MPSRADLLIQRAEKIILAFSDGFPASDLERLTGERQGTMVATVAVLRSIGVRIKTSKIDHHSYHYRLLSKIDDALKLARDYYAKGKLCPECGSNRSVDSYIDLGYGLYCEPCARKLAGTKGLQCKACGGIKPLSAFVRDKSKRLGVKTTCKECANNCATISGGKMSDIHGFPGWALLTSERQQAYTRVDEI